MAIFDVFEEVSEKKVLKTDTGDQRIFGVIVGEVVKNYHEDFPGKVCVSIHTRNAEENVLKWARLAMPSGGTAWGHYFIPEIGDQVLVVFEEGVIDRPFIIGCIQKSSNKFLKKSAHEKNQIKRIVTRHGSTIRFDDVADDNGGDGDGTKDVISIFTPDEAHRIIIDNDKKKIVIEDKEQNASIEMKTEKGDIKIHAARKITLEAGDTVSITMNGENGKLTVKAQDYSGDMSSKYTLNATGSVKIGGATFTAESQGMAKLSANGMTQISGIPIKIG